MHWVDRRPNSLQLGLLSLLSAVVVACDRGPDDGEASSGRSAAAAAQSQKLKDPLADMVSAVSSSRVSEPVELKFALGHRPQVGKPVEVQIAVLPISPLVRLEATFQAGTGLELLSGQQMAAVSRPEPGVPLPHRLTLVPQRDGIFFVSAVVQADSKDQSISRTFSIPIIAGEGLPKREDEPAPRAGEPEGR